MCHTEFQKPKHSPPPLPPGFSMETKFQNQKFSILLDLSASNDLVSFKKIIEEGEVAAIDEASLWYGRRIGSRKMGFEKRTPLMISAMYGSVEILKYILSKGIVDVNRSCGSDHATALRCAAEGGSPSASEIVRILIDFSAGIDFTEAHVDSPKKIEMVLKGDDEMSYSKKDYLIDVSLPDINEGVYGSDEFRIYMFKVKPCSRAYSHDWTECPFVHPGENARRRDPSKYKYSCVPCMEFRKGMCIKGDACEYAHGVFECWLHPTQYRTRICKDETRCRRRVCFFAHKKEELRSLYSSTGFEGNQLKMCELSNVTGSLNGTSSMSELMSLKLALQSFTGEQVRQYLNQQQLQHEYSTHGMHPSFSLSAGVMNSRSAAFANRSQSFSEHALMNRSQSFSEHALMNRYPSGLSAASARSTGPVLMNWDLPNEKLDRRIQCGELMKLRKSASFGIHSNADNNSAAMAPIPLMDEPDISWVQSLVNDGSDPLQQDYHFNKAILPSWAEQPYMEQEYTVLA